MKPNTISPTVKSPGMATILNAYKEFSGNKQATSEELFLFLTSPSAERDLFLSVSCSCTTALQGDIIYPVYSPL